MKIGRLTEADLLALAGLYRQFWGEESCPEKMRTTFRRLTADPRYLLLGARDGGRLVGSAMGIVCEELYGDCQPFLVVEDVIVDETHRRLGIGAALMGELERLALKSGCSYVILVTESDREDARRFYSSLGFGADTHRGFKKRLVPPAGHRQPIRNRKSDGPQLQ
jgi:GNAT superfamily N-acetyltransferase